MAIFTGGALTQEAVTGNVQTALMGLRRALEDVTDLHTWIIAYSTGDLEALNFSAADAQAIFTALADAAKLADLYNGGALGSYTLPYNFSASMRQVIGPLR